MAQVAKSEPRDSEFDSHLLDFSATLFFFPPYSFISIASSINKEKRNLLVSIIDNGREKQTVLFSCPLLDSYLQSHSHINKNFTMWW